MDFVLVRCTCLARAFPCLTPLGFVRPTLAGVPPACLFIDSSVRIHSHSDLATAASASRIPSDSLVPSSWFRTTSMVSSAQPTSGLLHPDANREVHRVSGLFTLPRDAARTPRRILLPQSRIVSPRPLPPCRFNDFVALLPAEACGLAIPLTVRPDSVLPGLGSPFEILR